MANCDSIATTRRNLLAGGLAAAVLPIAASLGSPVAGAEELDRAACLARTEQVIHCLRTRYVCDGWQLDEEQASVTLDWFRRGMPDHDPAFETVIRFFGDHGQSLDWIFMGNPVGFICSGAAKSARAAETGLDAEPATV